MGVHGIPPLAGARLCVKVSKCPSWSPKEEQNWQKVMHGVDFLSDLSSLAQQEVSGSLLSSATDPSHDLGSDP